MAKIPKTGIANASTIQASHITNIIESLDGTGSYDVTATGSFSGSLSGSFSGSFTGDGSGITGVTGEWDGTHVGDARITGSLNVSGSTSAILSVGDRSNPILQIGQDGNSRVSLNIAADPTDDPDKFYISYQASSATTAELALGGTEVQIGDVEGTVSNTFLLINSVNPSYTFYGGALTASADISSSATIHASAVSASVGMSAPTGSFNHIITDGDTIEFRNAGTQALEGTLKFDPTNGLSVDNNLGEKTSVKAARVSAVTSGGTVDLRNGHVTASGHISASGTIIANKLESANLVSHLGDANTGIAFGTDTVVIESNDIDLGSFSTAGVTIGYKDYATLITGSTLDLEAATISVSGSSGIRLKSSVDGFSFQGEAVGFRGGYGGTFKQITNSSAVSDNILSQSVHPGSIIEVDMSSDTNSVSITVDNPDQWPAYSNFSQPRFTICMSGNSYGAESPRFSLARQGTGSFVALIYDTGSGGTGLTPARSIQNNGDPAARYEFVAISAEKWHVTIHGSDSSLFGLV